MSFFRSSVMKRINYIVATLNLLDFARSKIYSLDISHIKCWWVHDTKKRTSFSLYFVSFNYFGCYYVGLKIENWEVFHKIKSGTSVMKKHFQHEHLDNYCVISMKLHSNILKNKSLSEAKFQDLKSYNSRIHFYIFG